MLKRGLRLLKVAIPAIVLQWLALIFVVSAERALGWAMIVLIWIAAIAWIFEDEDLMLDEDEQFIQTESGYCYYDITGEKPVIYNLFVEPDSRGKGKARKLLELVIRIIRDTGYTGDILIEAKPKSRRIDVQRLKQFYESLGLEVIEEGLSNGQKTRK